MTASPRRLPFAQHRGHAEEEEDDEEGEEEEEKWGLVARTGCWRLVPNSGIPSKAACGQASKGRAGPEHRNARHYIFDNIPMRKISSVKDW